MVAPPARLTARNLAARRSILGRSVWFARTGASESAVKGERPMRNALAKRVSSQLALAVRSAHPCWYRPQRASTPARRAATNTILGAPRGHRLRRHGKRLYVADQGNDVVRVLHADGTISLFAGGPSGG